MKLWHKSHQENVWLTLLWMKTLQQAYYNQQHPLDAAHAGLKEETLDTDTGVWCPLLATVLHWPWISPWAQFTTFSCTLPSSLTCTVCQLMVQHRWVGLKLLSVQRWSYGERQEHWDVTLWTVHGSRYMRICFKDWLGVFFKASKLFIYLENSHDESINYICT